MNLVVLDKGEGRSTNLIPEHPHKRAKTLFEHKLPLHEDKLLRDLELIGVFRM